MIWLFVDTDRIVFRVVKRQYFVFGFLYEYVKPYGQIGADHMHESEFRQHPMPRHSHLLLKSNRTCALELFCLQKRIQ